MADKNIQLQDDNNNNLFPKTKSEIVMVDTAKTLNTKLVEMDASISDADTKATNAQQVVTKLETTVNSLKNSMIKYREI